MRFVRLFVLSLAFLVAACATTPRGGLPSASGPPHPPGVKIGAPYEVAGVRYTPKDDRGYDKKGIASWYGPNFHQKETANGEIYNQNDVTAAHKTLPMPSWVEVTNLDNGRKLTVRVNDRGPFVDGRIIDLSHRSAELLGVVGPGLANVRVRRVFPEGDWARGTPEMQPPVQLASAAPAAAPSTATPSMPTQPPTAVAPAPVSVMPAPPAAAPAAIADRFIQVAALSDEGRAKALASVLTDYGPAFAAQIPGGLWRVRIGPVAAGDIGNVLYEVQRAGYREARIVQ